VLLALLCAGAGAATLAEAAQKGRKELPREPLDLNTATAEQLEKLPGIGPTTAKAIVRFREKAGPFRRVEELLAVRGITKARLEKLKPHLTVKEVERKGSWEERRAGMKNGKSGIQTPDFDARLLTPDP
jgi:competence ComEA-like helix-hairpin-helix protein